MKNIQRLNLPLFFTKLAKPIQNSSLKTKFLTISTGLCTTYYLTSPSPNLAFFLSDNFLQTAKSQIESNIQRLKQNYGEGVMSFPKVNYSMRGDTYQIDFLIDQRKCDIFSLLVTAANLIEEQENKKKTNSKPFKNVKTMKVGKNMTFQVEFTEEGKHRINHSGTLTMTGSFDLERPNFKFIFEKKNEISDGDIRLINTIYELANRNTAFGVERQKHLRNAQSSKETSTGPQILGNFFSGDKEMKEVLKNLKEMGVVVYLPESKGHLEGLGWDVLAGYEKQKRDIEDTVLLSLTHSHIFDEITQQTRARFEKNRAKAVLFEGPPGTGKTTSAKIIASQVGIPLLYMPLESIMSKWYGEAETKLANVFENAGKLGQSILFIDEIDAIAGGRDQK